MPSLLVRTHLRQSEGAGHGAEPATKGERDDADRREIEHHRHDAAEGRAGANPDEIGTDERVPHHALKRRARNAERDAGQGSDQDTRRPDDFDDGEFSRVEVGPRRPGKRPGEME